MLVWLHHTAGYAVAPARLLDCPLHTVTGLWCPFCGGLRAVAALTHLDLAAALSFNLVVTVLLPLAVWEAVRGLRGRPRLTPRGWLLLGAVLLLFTVWRNVPALPLAGYLAP